LRVREKRRDLDSKKQRGGGEGKKRGGDRADAENGTEGRRREKSNLRGQRTPKVDGEREANRRDLRLTKISRTKLGSREEKTHTQQKVSATRGEDQEVYFFGPWDQTEGLKRNEGSLGG